MDKQESHTFCLTVLEHDEGFINFCTHCRQVHSAGTIAIGIDIDDGRKKFLIGYPEPFPSCCGVPMPLAIHVFETSDAAHEHAEKIAAQILDERSVRNINLLMFHVLGSTTTH